MGRIIPFVPDRVFPKSPLPDAAFPLPQRSDRPFRLPCNPSGKARLDGAFRVPALGTVAAYGLAHQHASFNKGRACGVVALACWSTPYVWWFRGNGPGLCIDLNDRFWARPYDPIMTRIGAKWPKTPRLWVLFRRDGVRPTLVGVGGSVLLARREGPRLYAPVAGRLGWVNGNRRCREIRRGHWPWQVGRQLSDRRR